MALGICFGAALGSFIDSLGMLKGLCLGMLIGLIIGAGKDKVVNKQVEETGYIIKAIEKNDISNEYKIALTDNHENEYTVSVSSGTMETEMFNVGDIVFMDENGDIEQAFDKDNE